MGDEFNIQNLYRLKPLQQKSMVKRGMSGANPAPNRKPAAPPPASRTISFIVRNNLADAVKFLNQSEIGEEDKQLLMENLKNRKISGQLAARIAYHYRQQALNYNGWHGSNYQDKSTQFLGVLAVRYGQKGYASLISRLARKNLNAFLISTDLKRARQLIAMKGDKLLEIYREILSDYSTTSPGSPAKIILQKKYSDLNAIIFFRGGSPQEINLQEIFKQIPLSSQAEEDELREILFHSSYADQKQNSSYGVKFKECFQKFFGRYLEADIKVKIKDKTAYAIALNFLEGLAHDFGFSKKDLDNEIARICKEKKCSLIPPGKKIGSISDLKDNIESAPSGLPKEVIDILQKTGYLERVNKNLNNITFVRDILRGRGAYSSSAEGTAFPILRRVEIDFFRDGKIIPAWQIAMILVHEAAHIEWRGTPLILQQSTPDERNAYAVTYEFLQKIQHLPGFTAESNEIKLRCETAVKIANRILGYPLDNLAPNQKVLPSLDTLKQRGLKSADQLDLSFYPTNPHHEFLGKFSDFERLAKRINPNINAASIKLLWEVLSGRSSLEVRYRTQNGILIGAPLIFEENGKPRFRLSESAGLKIAGFFDDFVKYFIPSEMKGKYQAKPYYQFLNRCRERSFNAKIPSNRALQFLYSESALLGYYIDGLGKREDLEYSLQEVKPFLAGKFNVFLKNLKEAAWNKVDYSDNLMRCLVTVRSLLGNEQNTKEYKEALRHPRQNNKAKELINISLEIKNRIGRLGGTINQQRALLDLAISQIQEIYKKAVIRASSSLTSAVLRNLLYQTELLRGQ